MTGATPAMVEDLRARAAYFRALAHRFDHAVVVFDESGVITHASPLTWEVLGGDASAVVGANIFDFVDPNQARQAVEALAWTEAHPETSRSTRRITLTVRGERRVVQTFARPLGSDPRVGGTVLYLRDVTVEALLDDVLTSAMRGDALDHTLRLIGRLAANELRNGGCMIAPAGVDEDRESGVCVGVPEHLAAWSRALDRARRAQEQSTPLPTDDGLVVMTLDDLPTAVARVGKAEGFRSCWLAPMAAVDGHEVGTITLWSPDDAPPSPTERRFFGRLARMAAFTVARWQKDRATEHAARHDRLTGLPNRAAFDEVIARAHANENGARNHLAVLYVDLDGFKPVNDEYGHLVGDRVLAVVAERLRRSIRDHDVVARLGGDEFAVLCREARGEAQPIAVAERIIAAVSRPIEIGDIAVCVGASIGIALDEAGPHDVRALVARADRALYEAKRRGRNRWHIVDRQAGALQTTASS